MKNQILQVSIEPLNYRLWQRALHGHIILLMTVGNKARERYQNETSCRVQKSSADKRRWPLILWRESNLPNHRGGGERLGESSIRACSGAPEGLERGRRPDQGYKESTLLSLDFAWKRSNGMNTKRRDTAMIRSSTVEYLTHT